MKNSRIVLMAVSVAVAFGLLFSTSRIEAAESAQSTHDAGLEARWGESLSSRTRMVEVENDEPPPLTRLIRDSDFVVIAEGVEGQTIGLRGKKPFGSKGFDMNEWMAGVIYSVKIQSILFSKQAYEENQIPVPFTTIEVLTKEDGTVEGGLMKDMRYLLFLRKIPSADPAFDRLELDRGSSYFRVITGDRSIFPWTGPRMEGPSKKGQINLSSGDHSKLANSIQQLCEAMTAVGSKERIRKLLELTESDDEILRSNAEYILRHLPAEK